MRIKSEWTLAASLAPSPHAQTCFLFSVAVLCLALAAGAAAQSVVPGFHARDRAGETGFLQFASSPTRKKAEGRPSTCTSRIETTSRPRKNPSDPAPPAIKNLAPSFLRGTGMFRIPVGEDGKAQGFRRLSRRSRESGARGWHSSSTTPDLTRRDALEKYAKKKKDRNDPHRTRRTTRFLFTFAAYEPRDEPHAFSKYKWSQNPAFKNPTSRFSAIFPQGAWLCVGRRGLRRTLLASKATSWKTFPSACFWEKSNKGSHFMQERYELFSLGCGSQASRNIRFRRPQIVFELLPSTSGTFYIQTTRYNRPAQGSPCSHSPGTSGLPSRISRAQTPPIGETFPLEWV